jgi:Zn-dependent protease with chaperone function
MVRAKLKTPEGRKFLLALLVVFMIAAACVGRATIVGVIEQYNIPSQWTTSMYVLQSAMIFVYSLVFTVLLAIPLGIFSWVDAKSIKRYSLY